MVNYYELLGIDNNASKEVIKIAYKKMVKKYHPDVSKDKDSEKIIRSLNEAKETLLDDNKRREYDLSLNSINEAKQFSKEKEETYEYRREEYREAYSDTYVTRWEYFKSYIKCAGDNIFIKLFKTLIVGINHLFFMIIKLLIYMFVYVLFLLQELIDYFAGLLVLLGIIAIFVLNGKDSPNIIPYIPANIEGFLIFTFSAFFIEFIKLLIFGKYGNLFGLINKIENKILVKILNMWVSYLTF